MKRFVPRGLLSFLLAAPCGAVEFKKDVLPILESHCLKCHKDGKEKGDLNLQPDHLSKSIGSGRIIQPGKPSGGLFMKVILSDDPDNRMPPKGSRLSEKDVQTLKIWISRGAELEMEEEVAKVDPDAPEPLEGTWTNKEGKEIEATLFKVADGKAHLRMKDGKVYPYTIAKLSEESQAKVKEWAAKK